MKRLFKYRDSSYFNDTDYFLLINNLGQLSLTKVELYNGYWFAKPDKRFKGGKLYPNGTWIPMNFHYNESCSPYKMTTVECVNATELIGKKIGYIGTELIGTVSKFITNNIGIDWSNNQGKKFKEYGLPTYWNELKNLKLI